MVRARAPCCYELAGAIPPPKRLGRHPHIGGRITDGEVIVVWLIPKECTAMYKYVQVYGFLLFQSPLAIFESRVLQVWGGYLK